MTDATPVPTSADATPAPTPSPAPSPADWSTRNGSGHAADPQNSDPTRFAQVRNEDGTVVLKERAADGSIIDDGSNPGVSPAANADTAQPDMDALARDVQRAALPPSPDAYELKLPESFQVPPGAAMPQLDLADPAWGQARDWAHRHGLSQAAFEEGIGLLIGREMAQRQPIDTRAQQEFVKLGPNGKTRVDAVTTWLRGYLGDDIARPMVAAMSTEAQVRGFEKIISHFVNGGVRSFNGAHRDTPNDGQVSDEQYQRMSYSQRKDYAARMSAAQNTRNRR